jgi:hypothetical protein
LRIKASSLGCMASAPSKASLNQMAGQARLIVPLHFAEPQRQRTRSSVSENP